MRRLPALVAALLLPATPPLLLGTAALTGALLISQAPAQAQSAEAVAKVAQAITVRIEGATQGSGVLVKRDGNRYTVLTVWHVVSGQSSGEELAIFTPDGQQHQAQPGSIKHLGDVDMAVLSFSTANSYQLAKVGAVKSVSSGDQVLVAGFPGGINSKLKYDNGKLVANAAVGIDQGYQLLYTNETVSGMSGGVVLKSDGTLIGLHGRGERDEKKSINYSSTVKTGTNQGVPISYYSLFEAGAPVVASATLATTADDYLAQARSLLGKKGNEQKVISLATQVLVTRQSADAYFYRAYTKSGLGDKQGAIADYNQAIVINPRYNGAYINRGNTKSFLGDNQGAILDYDRAIAINPQSAQAYYNRGIVKYGIGSSQAAMADYDRAITLNPQYAEAYVNRGNIKSELGDNQGAISDFSQAILADQEYVVAYYNRGNVKSNLGDKKSAIIDYKQAITINPSFADAYYGLGSARLDLGDNLIAIDDFTKAISINPKNAIFWKYRGLAKYSLGDGPGAATDITTSIAINPKDAAAWALRGLARYLSGNNPGACNDFKKATSLGYSDTSDLILKICP